jgi:hypothetical protein
MGILCSICDSFQEHIPGIRLELPLQLFSKIPRMHTEFFHNSINRLVFIMDKDTVLCQATTQLLYTIYKLFSHKTVNNSSSTKRPCMDEDVLSRNNCIHVQTMDILIPVFCCLKVQLTLISQKVNIVFLLAQFSPASCYFLSLRLKQLSQHPSPNTQALCP